jgi:putative ABC transport system permease protein
MTNLGLWMRWSWRDLRARWLQVVAIALIIALGTGVFAGLGGQETWRTDSLDTSYERLNFHDIHVNLADGSYASQSDLLAALDGIDGVTAAETRLVMPTLVDASTEDHTILVEGRITGVDVTNGGPQIDRLYVREGDGRGLTEADSGQNVALVEYRFADHYKLKPGSPLRISGDVSLDFVGTAQSPEYFAVIPENGSFLGEASLAILFVPLATVQRLAGREGLVNDVVFTLADGADREAVRAEIERRMADAFPTTGITIDYGEDNAAYKMLSSDAKNDQATWDMVALLFLIGAALGAFNLAGRIVAAQRRQIGIGMALGVPRRWIAFRPQLVGFQIAVLGTIFGLAVGLGLGWLFANLLKDLLPLPHWDTSFYMPGYVQATALGILLPFVATLIPVWRAVRVAPIDAITSGTVIAKGGGLNGIMHYLPIPGRSFTQMPFRNLLRSPWRSLFTVLGIAMAILLMTAFVGFLDTFLATMDRAEAAYLYEAKDRVLVNLDFFYPVDSSAVTGIKNLANEEGTPLFTRVEAGLALGGTLKRNGKSIDTLLELHDMQDAIWVPDLLEGLLPAEPQTIVLSEKAADDLGVGVGDTITLEHPLREGLLAFRLVETDVTVAGIHNNPVRAFSYMDLDAAGKMGLAGVTNLLVVNPSQSVGPDDIKLALMTQPGVASVQAVAEFSEAFDEVMSIFVNMLRIVQGIVLFMAFLIAFNSTSINVDERVREISTMFAFGLPIRTVTRMQVIENLIVGVLGTVVGVIVGWYVLNAVLTARVEEQLADFKFVVVLSPETLAVSMLLGILVVALTPLLSIRRMARMDIPSTLRVME